MPVRVAWFASAAAIVATLIVMGVWSVRMAVADYWFRLETVPATRKAIRLEPDSAAYYARLAAMLQETDPLRSTQALQRAVALNPWDSQSWVELGLRAETAGDLAGAERYMLTAARVDKLYFPKWSLVNFYFRRGDREQFWFWARQAVEMAYGDLAPLFSLCWNITSDGELIERKLDIRKADAEAGYLSYLIGQNRIEPMTRAARRLLASNREADVPVLMAACDRLIADEDAGRALPIWNRLAELHRISYRVLQPETGQSLTDGDFDALPTSQGFDWRLPGAPGVTVFQERPAGLHVTFSGRQPESCEVLVEYLPVMENSGYQLRYRYRTSGIAPGTGLAWRITDFKRTRVFAQGASLAAETETAGQLTFQTPAGGQLVRLALVYQRALGTTRIEGSIMLIKAEIVPAPTPAGALQ